MTKSKDEIQHAKYWGYIFLIIFLNKLTRKQHWTELQFFKLHIS